MPNPNLLTITLNGTAMDNHDLTHLVDGTAAGSVRGVNAFDSTAAPLGVNSVALGFRSMAPGTCAFSSGNSASASGNGSIAVGTYAVTTVSATNSAAFGSSNQTNGANSFVCGMGNVADGANQFVAGRYNTSDSTSAVIIGNGSGTSAKSNALTLDWSGAQWLADTLTVSRAPTANMEVATKKYVDDLVGAIALAQWPVGSYYETSDASFDPNTSWGGTWVLESEGQFHVSAGTTYTAGSTGGAATVTLTENELPSIAGQFNIKSTSTGLDIITSASGHFTKAATTTNVATTTNNASSKAGSTIRFSFGGGGAHENMPPYVAVYRWHRTA